MKLVLDTGARFSFLPKVFLAGRQEIGKEQDFYPGNGEFETPIYSIGIRLGRESFRSHCGILPPPLELALKATGIDGLLGMDLLDYFQIQLALPEMKLYLDYLAPIYTFD